MYIINAMTASDIDRAAGIAESCGFLNWDDDSLKYELRKKNISYFFSGRYFNAGEEDNAPPLNRIVSFAGFWLINKQAHIVVLAVAKEYRRRGFGAEMLSHIIKSACALNAESVLLEAAKDNFAARFLYEKAGFVLKGARQKYYGKKEDGLTYFLNIKNAAQVKRII